jgi:hypothetical protein
MHLLPLERKGWRIGWREQQSALRIVGATCSGRAALLRLILPSQVAKKYM